MARDDSDKGVIIMEEKKKLNVSGMVLGIIGTVFAFFLPVVTYACSITGLVCGIRKRRIKNSTASIALNTTALIIAAFNSIVGILVTVRVYGSEKQNSSDED